jgi:diamine N-acetyltransferase
MTSSASLSPSITLRAGNPDDAAVLAELAERTFRDAFGAANTAENMDAYVGRAYSEAVQRRELAEPSWHTLMAEHEGVAIAFAQLRVGVAPACVTGAAPVELLRIYVDRDWHGQGVAQALMEEVIAIARARGGRTLHLGVWEHNVRALAFYAKYGFVDVGEREFLLGSAVDRDRILARAI